VDFMMDTGMDAIAAHENSLRDYAVAKLAGLNWIQVQGTTVDKEPSLASQWMVQRMRMTSQLSLIKRALQCVLGSIVLVH